MQAQRSFLEQGVSSPGPARPAQERWHGSRSSDRQGLEGASHGEGGRRESCQGSLGSSLGLPQHLGSSLDSRLQGLLPPTGWGGGLVLDSRACGSSSFDQHRVRPRGRFSRECVLNQQLRQKAEGGELSNQEHGTLFSSDFIFHNYMSKGLSPPDLGARRQHTGRGSPPHAQHLPLAGHLLLILSSGPP